MIARGINEDDFNGQWPFNFTECVIIKDDYKIYLSVNNEDIALNGMAAMSGMRHLKTTEQRANTSISDVLELAKAL